MSGEEQVVAMEDNEVQNVETVQQDEDSSKFKTPPQKQKKIRRRQDGSPVLPLNTDLPPKRIYMIRHGQSEAQAAQKNGRDRKKDPTLLDCDLTERGRSEALGIPKLFSEEELESVQLVLSSPLTRALHTSVLGFPTKPILVQYHLREVGSRVPENIPRRIEDVLADLSLPLSERDESYGIDVTSLRPSDWPRDYSPSVIKIDRIHKVFKWLYNERQETVIAVVCHFNVIKAAVIDSAPLRPRNAEPIRCLLYSNGELMVDDS